MSSDEDKKFEENKKLVYYVIHKYKFNILGQDFEDLVQAGNIGLIKAIREYDGSKNISFSLYAIPCIYNEIAMLSGLTKLNYLSLDEIVCEYDCCPVYLKDILIGDEAIDESFLIIDGINKILASYNDRNKKIIRLILAGCAQREICNMLNISQPSVSKIFKKFKNELKQVIE